MKDKLLIVANWKSNKTTAEALDWLAFVNKNKTGINFANKEIVLCPSFTCLSACYSFIKNNNLPIILGGQDLSEYAGGAYTGEVSARQIKEFCSYVIIGHSERKKYFSETGEKIKAKLDQAKKQALKTILCVQDANDFILETPFVAYEPPSAISTLSIGKPASPENIKEVFLVLKKRTGAKLLYGGSLSLDNIKTYLAIEDLAGFLVGGASLDPQDFTRLLWQC